MSRAAGTMFRLAGLGRAERRALRRDTAGATLVEFAIVAPVLVLFLIGFLDYGYWMYVRSFASGALESTARAAGVGGAAVNTATLHANVETQIKKLVPNATFVWDPRSYYQYSGINKPEKLVSDNNGNGSYDAGDCWQDSVPNGVYDLVPGNGGVGGADDIVFYKMTVTFPPLVSIGGFIPGLGGDHVTTVNTIIRRQPYAAQATPVTRC